MFRRNSNKRSKSNYLFLSIPALVLILFFYTMNFTSTFRTSMKMDWTGISQPIRDTLGSFTIYEDEKYVFEFDRKDKSIENRKMQWVLKNATMDELEKLTDHPHGMIKTLSYLKLMYSDFPNKFELLNKAFKDSTTFVYVRGGCSGNDFLLSEFLNDHGLFLNDRTLRPLPPKGHYNKFGLSRKEVYLLSELLTNQIDKKDKYLKNFYFRK